MEFHMINITYAAMHVCAETEKTTFSCKDDCTLTKHTRRWIYSALRFFLFYFLNKNMLMLVPYPFIVKYWVGYSLINCLPCVRPSVIAIASAMVGRCLFIVCSMMAFTTFYTTFSYISLYTRQSSWVRYFIQYILWILSVSATRYK